MRRCSKCGIEKDLSEFPNNKTKALGKDYQCKECAARFQQNYYMENKDRLLEQNAIWQRKNPESKRKHVLKSQYGLAIEEYERMYEAQNGLCAICGQAETTIDPRTKKIRKLAIDHDHETGNVRGLLCSNCNKGIGCLQDSVSILQLAINYLIGKN